MRGPYRKKLRILPAIMISIAVGIVISRSFSSTYLLLAGLMICAGIALLFC